MVRVVFMGYLLATKEEGFIKSSSNKVWNNFRYSFQVSRFLIMISKLQKTFDDLAKKGLGEEVNEINYVRGKMINSFILLYTFFILILIVIRIATGALVPLITNVIIAIQMVIAYLLSIKKDPQIGALYFLFTLLAFQLGLLSTEYHITLFLYLAALPILFSLLFDTAIKKRVLFLVTFLLVLAHYYFHKSYDSVIYTYLNIIGISYYIISKFIRLIEKNQTALNQALEEKQLIIEKLNKRNKELEQFNFITSHDLKEPLKTITTYSNLLSNHKDHQLDKLSKDSLHFMQQAANRMTSLIDKIYEHSRIGSMSELSAVNLSNIVKQVKKELLPIIVEQKASITYDPLPTIIGYEKELFMLFHSLLTNAIRFKKKEIPPIILISVIEKERKWEFIIKDNGKGIESRDQDSIFKMFYQLETDKNVSNNGTGLAHCRKIVELHEGAIWVDSIKDRGSSFHFTIQKKLETHLALSL